MLSSKDSWDKSKVVRIIFTKEKLSSVAIVNMIFREDVPAAYSQYQE